MSETKSRGRVDLDAPSLIVHSRKRLSEVESNRKRIERRAIELLERHPHFHGRTQFVQPRMVGQTLVLDGFLPSYYLKQMAQEAMKELEGIRIENRIVVPGGM